MMINTQPRVHSIKEKSKEKNRHNPNCNLNTAKLKLKMVWHENGLAPTGLLCRIKIILIKIQTAMPSNTKLMRGE